MSDKVKTGSQSLRTRSQVSGSSTSKRSRGSATSAAAVLARAEAEAAKAEAAFAEKESQLKMEQARFQASVKVETARIEVSLDALKLERRAAAAVAKAEALEAAMDEQLSEKLSSKIYLQTHDSMQRTKAYVEEHAQHTASQSIASSGAVANITSQPGTVLQHAFMETTQSHGQDEEPSYDHHPQGCASLAESQPGHTNAHILQTSDSKPQKLWSAKGDMTHKGNKVTCNDQHKLHSYHEQYTRDNQGNPADNQNMSDFVRFFARRELVSTGLLQFDDRPESYRAWKASFCNAIRGLTLTPSEEMDLLVKWLGAESTEHVRRIRAVHVHHPRKGLMMAWDRLDESYGSPEVIENSLFQRVDTFPKISNKDHKRLRELGDLLMELAAAKSDGDLPGLAYLDTARGINPIVHKLPYNLQEKWLAHGSKFKEEYKVPFPPFSYFVDFVCQQAKMRNDPSFSLLPSGNDPQLLGKSVPKYSSQRSSITVHKTEVSSHTPLADTVHRSKVDPTKLCPVHNKQHPLPKCRGFREKSIEHRKALLKHHGICYKCCASSAHLAKNCDSNIKCAECGSDSHVSALHPGPAPWSSESQPPASLHGGEKGNNGEEAIISSSCTQICGRDLTGKSCSKICLVKIYPACQQEKAIRVYAILDEQSNRSLVRSEFFDLFNIKGHDSPYSLKTCAGVVETTGRRAHGFQVESIDGQVVISLPTLIECNTIPNNRSEIPTPEAALHHAHLQTLAHKIPRLDPQAPIMILLGRDIIRVHKVRDQINGSHDSPYAQRLDLGWVIVGNVCLGTVHKPAIVSTYYTNTLDNGRCSVFEPCPNRYVVKEKCYSNKASGLPQPAYVESSAREDYGEHLGCNVFQQTKNDDKRGLSVEDVLFLKMMEQGVYKDLDCSWVAPLPFRKPRPRLPDNRQLAADRLFSLRRSLRKKPEMKEHFISFMDRIFESGHAEVAPPLGENEECWYLPFFGVYHPKKPGQIRVVFDSSAQYKGVSLNQVLLTGPDLNNSLLGVLIRFRKDSVAITADIQQMFHCFIVRPEDRNFLRFLWYADNNLENAITEYRMKVHVFGNSPSPAVAVYCLRRAAEEGERESGKEPRQFIERDFYVDDGLKSLPTPEMAINLLKRTQNMLASSNLRLHKIASNSREVMEAFPIEDRAKDLKDLDLGVDALPIQRSLGLCWDLKTDAFLFQVAEERKPFTRRGVLSTVNSLYDPLGFVAPITVQGKALLRDLSTESSDWDAPLPPDREEQWEKWRESLKDLQHLKIPRSYTSASPAEAQRKELCVFSDASEKAIAAVAYLKISDQKGNCHTGFILGKARLAPRPEQTIPRLELCAAVMAVEMAELITSEIDVKFDAVTFYTDSKVVLGYIFNEKRRFYVYVTNRIQRIRRGTQPQQWHYVSTEHNPADHATRFVPAAYLKDTNWLSGPVFLSQPEKTPHKTSTFALLDPEQDKDIRPQVTVLTTNHEDHLGTQRFERFSDWKVLIRAISRLRHIACLFKEASKNPTETCKGWHHCRKPNTVEELTQSRNVIIQAVQQEMYGEEIQCIRNQKDLPKDSPLRKLDPFIDADCLLRVGGRIQESQLGHEEKRPLIIPRQHHVAFLLVRHYHVESQHQGRHFTEGILRSAGYWIVGAKRCISSYIFKCITCRKLRGTCEVQKMADLPPDRLSMEPPFTHVGVDVFGPWTITARRTRGGHAESKRWAVLFTCLSIRAIHLEVIESMDSSSFINALRRFLAIRGPVKHIRSDRGTNFIGACKDLRISSNIDDVVKRFLAEKGCTWTFNPPHSSHMGGAWERMIGVTRKILDSMLLQSRPSRLTHEVLTTFMAEVMAIVNNRPLVPLSTDANDPFILTPATLLTQKSGPHPIPPGEFDSNDMYKRQWRQVQSLASTFWDRWRKQYLCTLQTRKKWTSARPNVAPGSVVLIRDCQSKRNDWPLGVVTQVFPSKDGRVRKVEVKISRQDGTKLFLRPVTELVLLLSPDNQDK